MIYFHIRVALPYTERTRAVQSAFTASSVFLTTFLAGAAGASMKVKADSLDSIPSASTPSDLTITDKVFLDIKIANYTAKTKTNYKQIKKHKV